MLILLGTDEKATLQMGDIGAPVQEWFLHFYMDGFFSEEDVLGFQG